MDLIFAKKITETSEGEIVTGFYLASISLAEKYARRGYTIYIKHEDGSLEKYMDPIIGE